MPDISSSGSGSRRAERPDFPSRVLLRCLRRKAHRNACEETDRSGGGSRQAVGEALPPDALRHLRRVTGRPSFPIRLSSLQLDRVLDLRVPGATELRPARLYVPRGRVRGVVLYLHGGGFVHCGLNSHHGICCRIARQSGAAVLSFDYRLAPENRFPAAIDDAWAALRWLSSEAWRWGGKVAVAGDSAGGTIAAVLCRRARDAGRNDPASAIRPVMQLLFYPSTLGQDMTPSRQKFASGYFLTMRMIEWYGGQYARTVEDARNPDFAPALAGDLRDLPPAWIVTAECDPLRDEAEIYARALEAAGNRVTCICMAGTLHAFLQFYPLMPKARRALRESGRALRQAFRPSGDCPG